MDRLLAMPDANTIWRQAEARLIQLVCLAAERLLMDERVLPIDENEISRKLSLSIRKVNNELRARKEHVEPTPVFRCRIQPDPDFVTMDQSENKEPDMMWEWWDSQEQDPARATKYYHIECKRLGTPPSKWCVPYVTEGVKRFISAKHNYGKGLHSGAMLGYVQTWEFAAILDQVNKAAAKECICQLILSEQGWQEGGITRLAHTLIRPDVKPSPFALRHFWIDVRKHTSSGEGHKDSEV